MTETAQACPTSLAVSAQPTTTTTLTPADGKAFMDVILYGAESGWERESSVLSKPFNVVGHKKLLQNVLAARHYNKNENAGYAADGSNKAAAATADEENKSKDGNVVIAAPGYQKATETEEEAAELAEVKSLLIDARKISAAADEALAGGLINCEDWMTLRDNFYNAGAIFSLAGLPDDAARCLLQATFINRAFKDEDEALSSLTLSVQHIKLAHPVIACESLARLAASYERNKLIFQAARCLREAAEIYDGRLDEKDSAIEFYTAAIAMYRRIQNPYRVERSLIDQCHERLCFLHTYLGHYDVVEKLFLEKAKSIPRNLPATRFYLYATLAVLARGHDSEDAYFDSIYDTKKWFDNHQESDRGYQKGKENELMRELLLALEHNALNEFDVAVDKYKSYSTTMSNAAFDLIVERCRQNLFDHVERFA